MTPETTIAELLSQDDLARAIAVAGEAVRARPQSEPLRLAFVDLLILSGDLERADRQAGVAATLDPKTSLGISLLRNQIRGIDARAAWFERGAVPAFPGGPTACDEAVLRLNLSVRAGNADEARAQLDVVETLRRARPVRWNEDTADDLRDCDDLIPHALEVVTDGGAYLWVDLSRIEAVSFEPIARPRDLAFRRAELTLRNGSSATVLVPATYHGGASASDAQKLGRETDWVEMPGGIVAGRGQRCFLVGDEIRPISEGLAIELAMAEVPADG